MKVYGLVHGHCWHKFAFFFWVYYVLLVQNDSVWMQMLQHPQCQLAVESFSMTPMFTSRMRSIATIMSKPNHSYIRHREPLLELTAMKSSTSWLSSEEEPEDADENSDKQIQTRILTRKQPLYLSKQSSGSSSSKKKQIFGETHLAVDSLVSEWLRFCWKQGGGLPWISPIILKDDMDGKETKIRRWIVPLLLECVTSVQSSQIEYRVENPGVFTYPVRDHHGTIQFVKRDNDDGVYEMIWQVEVVPMNVGEWQPFQKWVEWFTAAVITTISRNYAIHVTTPNATVAVAPPRGKGAPFAQVPADTWLGGVLEAHLRDSRSTYEQTASLFQPWTWGRCKDEPESGACTEWADGVQQITAEP